MRPEYGRLTTALLLKPNGSARIGTPGTMTTRTGMYLTTATQTSMTLRRIGHLLGVSKTTLVFSYEEVKLGPVGIVVVYYFQR